MTDRNFINPIVTFGLIIFSASALAAPPDAPNCWLDPARVEGHEQCKECHVAEYAAWRRSTHATDTFDLLRTSDNGWEYFREYYRQRPLLRRGDMVRADSVCLKCHATLQIDDLGRRHILAGVSCEQCHGASGGEDGWLNFHAVYGPPGTVRRQETAEHRAIRQTSMERAGQARGGDAYQLAKNCLHCHLVADERLLQTGHSWGDSFEMASMTLGEVRHNFLLNPAVNAKAPTLWTDPHCNAAPPAAKSRVGLLYLVGLLVELEVSFDRLSRTTADSYTSYAMMERINQRYRLLTNEIVDKMNTPPPELTRLIEAIKPLCDRLANNEYNSNLAAPCRQASVKSARVAKLVSQGKVNLPKLDALEILPDESEYIGEPFQP